VIYEPAAEPRLRYEADPLGDGWQVVAVTHCVSGQVWAGAEAQALWDAKRDRDAVAVQAVTALAGIIPDFYERRLDVGGVVVFGLPVEHADQHGDTVAAALSQIAAGDRLAAVWA
jgi:hypothetical protein